MIKELRLKHWKSFDEATLYIDPLTIIIGANASGKSNTLDALTFLHRISSGIGIFQAINGDANLPALRGGMEWVCLKPNRRFSLEILTDGLNSQCDYRYHLTVEVNSTKAEVLREELIKVDYRKRSDPIEKSLFNANQETGILGIPVYFATGTQGRGKRIDLNRTHAILSQTETLALRKDVLEASRYVLSQLQKVFVFDPIPSHMRDYSPLSDQLSADGANIAGVLAGLETPRRESVEHTLTGYLKALPEKDIQRVWTETVGKFNADAMLYCEEGWSATTTHEIDARGMSDGTLRYLGIVAALLTREPGSLLVIEEVDNGLHPSRSHVLLDMLQTLGKERSIDVLVTTHNPALLDAAGAPMVPFITVAHRDQVTGASELKQLEDLQQLPKLLAFGNVGKLSSEGRIESALKLEDQQ